MAVISPDRTVERELLAQLPAGTYLAGVDEVGRGSIAGPASVGIALVNADTVDEFPAGLRDSKMISAHVRESLVEPVHEWVSAYAVGHASPQDVNEAGILGALRIAAARALEQLDGFEIAGVLLDGSHDWWSSDGLFDAGATLPALPVRMEVKGDARCAVVAAASVLAKVERDRIMVESAEAFPGYGFERNKGYASAEHIHGLETLGASAFHRTAWKLPGIGHTK
ncbi:Ribonuclease HII [Arcanobacterium haemolyticum]|uniref:ribonuclease HII n=1 Tax=Arcanobacterium haemolyticum TaxID=28264 RepID=UPI000D9D999A|nr:ribonuclease HII [Arcanobacterium haemolyticum]SPT75070.1 Ribonuclease HII [Arcanobacterium haemolyticum]